MCVRESQIPSWVITPRLSGSREAAAGPVPAEGVSGVRELQPGCGCIAGSGMLAGAHAAAAASLSDFSSK